MQFSRFSLLTWLTMFIVFTLFLSSDALPFRQKRVLPSYRLVDLAPRAETSSTTKAAAAATTTTKPATTAAAATTTKAAVATTTAVQLPATTSVAVVTEAKTSTAVAVAPSVAGDPAGPSTSAKVAPALPTATAQSINAQSGAQVSTGISGGVIAGLSAVGGLLVLGFAFFTYIRIRRRRALTSRLAENSNPFSGASGSPAQGNSSFPGQSSYERLEESKPIGTFTVVSTYIPTLGDELDIQVGDKVTVLAEFDDGWVHGTNDSRGGIKGVFPKYCVDYGQPREKAAAANHGDVNARVKRTSSMFGHRYRV